MTVIITKVCKLETTIFSSANDELKCFWSLEKFKIYHFKFSNLILNGNERNGNSEQKTFMKFIYDVNLQLEPKYPDYDTE